MNLVITVIIPPSRPAPFIFIGAFSFFGEGFGFEKCPSSGNSVVDISGLFFVVYVFGFRKRDTEAQKVICG